MDIEYERYKEAIKGKKLSFYEQACKKLEKLDIEPDEKYSNEIKYHARFSHLRVTPQGVMGFAAAQFMVVAGIIVLLVFTQIVIGIGLTFSEAMFMFIVDAMLFYFFYKYPIIYSNMYRMRMKAGFIQAFMYMGVYLRDNPNLEGAIRYASENTSPPVSIELRRLLWELESGQYINLDQALETFLDDWKDDREILQTFNMFQNAINQPDSRRGEIIQEAISLMLMAYREKSKMFNQSIRFPLMALNAFGMLLPVIGIVMLPMFLVFMPEIVGMGVIAIMYDIIMPFIVFFLMNEIIRHRPISFEPPKIETKDQWWIRAFGIRIPILAIGAGIVIAGIIVAAKIWSSSEAMAAHSLTISLIIATIAVSELYVRGLDKKMDEIKRMEREFGSTVFNLGNLLATGYSLETAIKKSLEEMKKMKIKKLYEKILENVENGMLLDQAIFDRERGAVKSYPSAMISSILKTVVSSASKGSMAISRIMVSISTYLKEIFDAEIEIKDILGEVTGSVKFQAMILNPILIGSMTALTKMIFSVIRRIGSLVKKMEVDGVSVRTSFLQTMKNFNASIGQFIIILGIYLVESSILLTYLFTSIEEGENSIYLMRNISKTMKTVLIVYTITIVILHFMLGGSESVIINA